MKKSLLCTHAPALIVSLITFLILQSCASIPFTQKKTSLEEPVILVGQAGKTNPKNLIFLSPKEAECPNQCSSVVRLESYNRIVTRIEQRLQERGYNLISGAIVSRVENKLKESETREKWDRTEKALLLGKDTGADAIFEIRALYVDEGQRWFLKEKGRDVFNEKPHQTVDSAINSWAWEKPGNGWYLLPIFGWIRLILADSPPSSFMIPYWKAAVDARMIDLDGNIIWSGSKSVRSTDIIPQTWEARLDGGYPMSRTKTSFMGERDQNFDLLEYFENKELQQQELFEIIDALTRQMPKPPLK